MKYNEINTTIKNCKSDFKSLWVATVTISQRGEKYASKAPIILRYRVTEIMSQWRINLIKKRYGK